MAAQIACYLRLHLLQMNGKVQSPALNEKSPDLTEGVHVSLEGSCLLESLLRTNDKPAHNLYLIRPKTLV